MGAAVNIQPQDELSELTIFYLTINHGISHTKTRQLQYQYHTTKQNAGR